MIGRGIGNKPIKSFGIKGFVLGEQREDLRSIF
jgi:hypothetical protein